MERICKTNYYLDIAQTVASRSTCLRRKYGALIVKDDVIVSTGYNGAPRGRQNCTDLVCCQREKMNIPRGERFELCRSVHSEMNAIIAASRDIMLGSVMYQACVNPVTGGLEPDIDSCQMCKRLIINAGIATVVFRCTPTKFKTVTVADWVTDDDSLGTIGY